MNLVNKTEVRNLILFLSLSIVLVGIFFYIYQFDQYPQLETTYRELGLKDVFIIFGVNSLFMIFNLILAPIGLSLIVYINLVRNISLGPLTINEDPISYWLASLGHGLIELVLCYLTLRFTYLFYKSIISKSETVVSYYKKNFLSYLVPILIIVIVGSFIEVYISNKLFIVFTS